MALKSQVEVTLLNVEDGEAGSPGAPGIPGEDGSPGAPGTDGEDGSGVLETHRYYRLGTTVPLFPLTIDTLPPTGWSETEPDYVVGSLDNLYMIDLTLFNDGRFMYSPISLSSAYTASKKAYDRALLASTQAGEARYEAINAGSTAASALDSLVNDYTNTIDIESIIARLDNDIGKYSIANWAHDNDLTIIEGAKIAAGSIDVVSLNVERLSAISSNLGVVTTGVIRSADFDVGNGIELDFRDTTDDGFSVRSSIKNTTLKIDADGTRVYNNLDLTTPVAEFVENGVDANKVTAKQADIAGLQITKVGSEVWISSLN